MKKRAIPADVRYFRTLPCWSMPAALDSCIAEGSSYGSSSDHKRVIGGGMCGKRSLRICAILRVSKPDDLFSLGQKLHYRTGEAFGLIQHDEVETAVNAAEADFRG